MNHVTRGIRYTEADAQKYYDQNIAQFKVAAGRRVSHILVPTKAEADKIRAEVTPQNFAELARRTRPTRPPRTRAAISERS